AYLRSTEGLKISTRRCAIWGLLSLRISSSVFPENMEPQITSIQPFPFVYNGSININSPSEYIIADGKSSKINRAETEEVQQENALILRLYVHQSNSQMDTKSL